ncbi:MAG: hypothetical protein KC912_00290 [Proteobacteria bacterium]|nr:hypothetical protein [Pseudomonadota bacterium]
MMPRTRENTGDRPSRLTLARFHTGELSAAESAEVEIWIRDNPADSFLDELEASRSSVRPVDIASLRAASLTLVDEPAPLPEPANQAWRWALPLIVLAAALLFFARGTPEQIATTADPAGVTYKGTASLEVFRLTGEVLTPYEGEALGEGDTIGFRVVPGDHDHLVLLSVEVDGTVNILYPDPFVSGDASEPIRPGGHPTELPGSIILDGAGDPEVFVAVFGGKVLTAAAQARESFDEGGLEAVMDLADEPHIDAVEVVRK